MSQILVEAIRLQLVQASVLFTYSEGLNKMEKGQNICQINIRTGDEKRNQLCGVFQLFGSEISDEAGDVCLCAGFVFVHYLLDFICKQIVRVICKFCNN